MRACTSVVNAIKNDSHFGSRGGMNVTYTRHSFQPAFYSYRRTTLSIQQIQLILRSSSVGSISINGSNNIAPCHGMARLFVQSFTRSFARTLASSLPLREMSTIQFGQINKSNCKFLQFMYI